MYRILQCVNAAIERVIGVVIVAGLAVMVSVSFYQVISRIMQYPLSWTEELARYLAIWLAFLGASYALRRKALAQVEVILNYLKPHQTRILSICLCILILGFCVFLCFYGTNLALRMARQTSPALFISMGLVYSSAPISGAIMFLFTLEQLLDELFRPRGEA